MNRIGEEGGHRAEELGLIGLGMMGDPMARRLLKAGYEVTVWNRSSEKARALVKLGAKPASHLREVATSASIISCA